MPYLSLLYACACRCFRVNDRNCADGRNRVETLTVSFGIPATLAGCFQPFELISLGANSHQSSGSLLYPWPHMIYQIFQDVLDGRLFLQAAERVALYLQWDWILERIGHLSTDEPCASKVVREFMMTFPLEQQEEIILRWASSLDEYRQVPELFDLSESHIVWLLHLVTAKVPKLEEKQTASQNVISL